MREAELMEALRQILDRLNSGKIPITEEMVRRAQANGVLPRGGLHSTHISSQTSTYDSHLSIYLRTIYLVRIST